MQFKQAEVSLAPDYIIGKDSFGWYALCCKTSMRSPSFTRQSLADRAGQRGDFYLKHRDSHKGGGKASRPAAGPKGN